MNIPLSLVTWGTAVLPIIVLMFLMLKLQWGAKKAAPVGFIIAVVVALAIYKADVTLIGYEVLKGLWSAFAVLIIVWPAVLIYEVTKFSGAFKVFRVGMQKFSPNELLQVLLIGWVFVSFLQGITGFGVPVAVGAPLLVGLGVSPLWAVVIPLVGHSWANTFGTLAVAWDALVLQTNLASNPELLLETAFFAGTFIWIWNAIIGVSLCLFYGGVKALKKGLPAIIIISLIQGGGQLFLGQINQTLACFVPTCIALGVVLLLGKTKMYSEPWRIEDSKLMDRTRTNEEKDDYPKDMTMNQAFVPYYLLTFITLFVLLIAPIKEFLGQFKFGFAFPETVTGYGYVNAATSMFSPIAFLTHASVFLFLSSVLGFLYFKSKGWVKGKDFSVVVNRSLKSTIPSSIAVVSFIVMSRVMGGTGQTVVLARGIVEFLGQGFVVLSPVVGMLGAFMTSSNMASNILFAEFQLTTAELLSFDPAPILAAQTAGGAIGNTICPGNIILGATTAGVLGKEGVILKKVLPLALLAAVIIGLILFLLLVL